jgi:hypothetical protein
MVIEFISLLLTVAAFQILNKFFNCPELLFLFLKGMMVPWQL